MTRELAAKMAREELEKWNLKDWHVRINPVNLDSRFQYLALCSHKDKCIILNAHHVDLHDEKEILNSIRHEIAHALTPGQQHSEVWADKAREVGCHNVAACSHLSLPSSVIDAIRSGATVEVKFEEEIIRRPKYVVTRLQDKCEFCGKVAVTKHELLIPEKDPFKPDTKMIWLECGHILTKLLPKGTPFQTLLADGDDSCAHEWSVNKKGVETNVCVKCNGKRPFQFQIEGMKFGEQALAVNNGVLIMDAMGLGKTPQSIGLLKFHPEYFPVLCVVKSKIKFQWFKQWLRWTRDGVLPQIIQSSNDILIPGLKVYIIGFDMLVPKTRKSKTGKVIQQGFDITKFDKVGIKTLLIDECQHISNPDSTRTQQVRKVAKGRKVIGLSGTPWKNRGSEFYSILNMIAPMLFSSYQGYKDRWVEYYYSGRYTKEGGIKNPAKFKEYIKDIAIRREKGEVLDEYNPVNRMPLHIELGSLYQDQYDQSEGDFVNWYNDKIIGGESLDGIELLAKMSRMRHLAGLAKIPATVEFVKEFIEEKEGSLAIGVHHKDVAEYLIEKLKEEVPEVQVLALKAGGESDPIVNAFNSRRSVLVASTLAGGEGVDGLQNTCDEFIMHERQWNPANEEQFEGRLDRMGQKSPVVNGTYVMAEGTVDTIFDEIVERKRIAFHNAMNKGETPKWNQGDIGREMADMIVKRYREKNKGKLEKSITSKVG